MHVTVLIFYCRYTLYNTTGSSTTHCDDAVMKINTEELIESKSKLIITSMQLRRAFTPSVNCFHTHTQTHTHCMASFCFMAATPLCQEQQFRNYFGVGQSIVTGSVRYSTLTMYHASNDHNVFMHLCGQIDLLDCGAPLYTTVRGAVPPEPLYIRQSGGQFPLVLTALIIIIVRAIVYMITQEN